MTTAKTNVAERNLRANLKNDRNYTDDLVSISPMAGDSRFGSMLSPRTYNISIQASGS
jgi:hypothetical protein